MTAAPTAPEPNGVYCIDCDRVYRSEVECPEEPAEHGAEPVFVTTEALGRPDDADYWHFGLKLYVYDGEALA